MYWPTCREHPVWLWWKLTISFRLHRFHRLRDNTFLSLPDHLEEHISGFEKELLAQYEQLVATYNENVQIDVTSVGLLPCLECARHSTII